MHSNTAKTLIWSVCICSVFVLGNTLQHQRQSVPNLIRQDGYDAEVHHVTTSDGYILEHHRIQRGKNESFSTGRRPVVLIAHCIFCSSSSFVVLGPTKALAYMLADNGYDVWLMNSRGTKSSQNHVFLNPKSRKFWQFSWHEMGIFDVASTIDYILDKTGEKQINYVGFSMGTTQFFVLMSERPEYNSKIRRMTGMAPVSYFNSSTGPFPFKPPYSDVILKYGAQIGRLEFPPQEIGLNEQAVAFCRPQNLKYYKQYCENILWIFGTKFGNFNEVTLPHYLLYFPDSTSVRATTHYSQLGTSGRFAKYNYGQKMNKLIYGTSRPPSYDLSKITAPVNLIWSRTDTVSDHKDVKRLESRLPNVELSYEVPVPSFSHLDFIWAENAPTLVYKKIIERLKAEV